MQKRRWSAAALVTAAVLIVGACGGTGGTGGGSGGATTAKTVKIISSLPMTGSSRTQTVQIVNSIQMAIADTKIANVTVNFEALDDATAAKGSWDAATEAENARKAIGDSSVVAYIGTYNSGAAKISIPLLNQAGLVMVSPANTYPGLTKPGKGEANEPNTYFPNGKRNYARVVPADDLQGAVGAVWAKDLGAKKVYIVHDTQLYGKGIADVFRAKAKDLGLTEAGYEGAEKADNYRALANKIKDSGADFVYYGGIVDNNPAVLLKDIRSVLPSIKFMGPDGINCAEFLKEAGPAADANVYSTFGGVPPEKYTGKAADWLKAYNAKYGAGSPDPYAIYGYEAAKVVLAAIAAAGDKANDRATVLANVMGTKNYDGVLGKWSFDANGDTTLTQFSGSQAKSGDWAFVKELAVGQ
ncbi:MAG: branched-chain amino acid ABC transporter substrate-binding protein [Chloroflexi bacterium]|nr:MAG: branched-chain amino acid ABC transporter substrate-binding protein [Chloroflexota bacterium]